MNNQKPDNIINQLTKKIADEFLMNTDERLRLNSILHAQIVLVGAENYFSTRVLEIASIDINRESKEMASRGLGEQIIENKLFKSSSEANYLNREITFTYKTYVLKPDLQ